MDLCRNRYAAHAVCLLLTVFAGCGARSSLTLDAPDAAPPCTAAGEERCNGDDDDCDGRIDESIPPLECGPVRCPTVVHCEGGVMELCVPRPLTEETCNLVDDDCDGAVDEDLGWGPLGPVETLRTDEFETGDCISCGWASGQTLAMAGEGLMAVWRLGLSGGAERPNLYGRRLDRRGRPVGPIELLRDDFVLDLTPIHAVRPLPRSGQVAEAYYRIGSRDVFGALFLDRDGATRTVMPLAPRGARNVRRMAWAGERLIGVWPESGLRVASYSESGDDERVADVADFPGRLGSPTLGVYEGRVGVLVPVVPETGPREQWLVVLDATGEILSSRRVGLPYRNWQRLIGVEDGWIYIDPGGFSEAALWQRMTTEGEARTELRPFFDERALSDSGHQDVFVPRPENEDVVAVWQSPWDRPDGEMHVEILNAQGDITRSWSGPLPEEPGAERQSLSYPHLLSLEGQIVVVWSAGVRHFEPNSVHTLALGCVP